MMLRPPELQPLVPTNTEGTLRLVQGLVSAGKLALHPMAMLSPRSPVPSLKRARDEDSGGSSSNTNATENTPSLSATDGTLASEMPRIIQSLQTNLRPFFELSRPLLRCCKVCFRHGYVILGPEHSLPHAQFILALSTILCQ